MRAQGGDESLSDLSVLALTAINEILYKSYVPADFTSFLLVLFRNSFQILQSILADQPAPGLLCRLSDTYLGQVTELLRQFVSSHLRRCGQQPNFPTQDFLGLVFKFTFQQASSSGLLACLEVWGAVCDLLQGSRDQCREDLLPQYREALLALARELLLRVQYRHHSATLAQVDREVVGEEGTTEWQHLLATVLELVMRVADLLPEQVLQLGESAWRESAASYLALEQEVEGGRLRPAGHLLEPVLRDYCSTVQLCGRLCPLYLGEQFSPKLQAGLDTVKQLLLLADTGARLRLWSLPGTSPSTARSLLQCQASTLAALQAWCHWLAALHSESLQDSTYTWLCSDLTSRIVVAVVAALRDGAGGHSPSAVSQSMTHSAAHFLVTLTGTVRPPSIWKVKEFTDLYSAVPRAGIPLEGECHRLVVRSLCNVLLLHWPGATDQKWEDRRKHLAKFLRDLTEGFRSLKSSPNFTTDKSLQAAAEPLIVHTLQMLGDLVENVLNEVTQSKKLCHDVTREYIETSLWLFPLYVQSPKVCEEMFHFFHTVFDVLAAQMGSEFVEQAVHTFFSLFGQNLLADVVVQKKASLESRVVEKFLSILTFIVSEPGPSFRKFVSSSLSLCLDHIFPLVLQHESSELKAPLYRLLHHTLLHNWGYFFKSQLKLGGVQGEQVQHRAEFLALMRAIGQSFLQQDIAVFSQNIATLQVLHAARRTLHAALTPPPCSC